MGLTVYGGGGKPEEEKTVTAGTERIEVTPSAGKAIKKVTVNPTPTETKEVTAGTADKTVAPSDGKHIASVTVHPTPSQSKSVAPTTSKQTVSPDSGKLLSSVVVNAIKTEGKTVTSSEETQTVTPTSGKYLSKVTVNPIHAKAFDFIVVDSNSYTEASQSLTIKAITWDGTYWVALAVNSSGHVYCIYSTSLTGSWTVRFLVSKSAAIIPSGIAFVSGDNCYAITCRAGSYSDYFIMFMPRAEILSGSSFSIYRYTSSTSDFYDVTSLNGGRYWAVGGTTDGSYALSGYNATDGVVKSNNQYTQHGSVTKTLIKCCMYGTYPIAITADGYYTYKSSLSVATVNGQHQIDSGLTTYCVEEMGDYLVVAGTKTDGTYIYYAKGTPGSLIWKKRKISNTVYTPVALAYVDGMCVLAYKNGSNICFASATTPEGIWLTTATLGTNLSGYTPADMASDGTNICLASFNGSYCRFSKITSDFSGTGSGYGG